MIRLDTRAVKTDTAGSTTRERILEVALALFSTDGFRGTSISEIERRVGLSAGNGAFYRHFASKEELLRAAVQHEIQTCMHDIRLEMEASERPTDATQATAAVARETLRFIRRFDRLFRLMLREGERVADLTNLYTTELGRSQALGDWVADPGWFVMIAAILGYHTFTLIDTGAVGTPGEDEFINALLTPQPWQRAQTKTRTRPARPRNTK